MLFEFILFTSMWMHFNSCTFQYCLLLQWLVSPRSSYYRSRPSTPTVDDVNSSWYSLQEQVLSTTLRIISPGSNNHTQTHPNITQGDVVCMRVLKLIPLHYSDSMKCNLIFCTPCRSQNIEYAVFCNVSSLLCWWVFITPLFVVSDITLCYI